MAALREALTGSNLAAALKALPPSERTDRMKEILRGEIQKRMALDDVERFLKDDDAGALTSLAEISAAERALGWFRAMPSKEQTPSLFQALMEEAREQIGEEPADEEESSEPSQS
jgi:hypothetical protein